MATNRSPTAVAFLFLLCSLPYSTAFSILTSLPAEDIVRQQLNAFQENDIETAFSYASPANKVLTGPSWQEFGDLIQSEAAFTPILGHIKSAVLMTVHHDDWGICCLVRIIPKTDPRTCLEYWWELTKQGMGEEMAGCWMIDSVLPDFEDMSIDLDDVYYDTIDDFDDEE
jgi:hypothetical protein